ATLPDPRSHLTRGVDARHLDIRPVRKPRMRLEPRADPADLAGVAAHDRVRIADRHGDELDPVDCLGLADQDRAELLLDVAAREHSCNDSAVADAYAHLFGARLFRE